MSAAGSNPAPSAEEGARCAAPSSAEGAWPGQAAAADSTGVVVSARLLPFEADRLRSAALTYDEVGATAGRMPDGYHHLTQTTVIGDGRRAFEYAAGLLMCWGVQRGTGITVAASAPTVEDGAVAVLRLGWGPLAVRAPVRVVAVVDEPDRRGFAYGTLPGHPESGEESFIVEYAADGVVSLRIVAFARPRSWPARVAGPLGRLVQRAVTRRYGRALAPGRRTS
jgi:uncharacterized protein (UPF0548 family)